MSAYGYVRVSTVAQAEQGISLETQRKKIRGWCDLNDKKLITIFSDEGISGRTIEKRAGLKSALNILAEGDVFVVYSFSRLSRSTKDFLNIIQQIKEKKAVIHVIQQQLDTSTPNGKFVATMFAALAQLESDMTSERVKENMLQKAQMEEFVGRPPYGWKMAGGKGSDLVEVPEEQDVIKMMKSLRETTNKGKPMSFSKIAEVLNEKGISAPKGKKWYHSTVSRIIRRKDVKTKGRNQRLAFLKGNASETTDSQTSGEKN